jgi:nitrate/TMAO reductase-like tetraheme cytochrome c subunit
MPGLQAGLTYIDCHKGIAHHLPKKPGASWEAPKE